MRNNWARRSLTLVVLLMIGAVHARPLESPLQMMGLGSGPYDMAMHAASARVLTAGEGIAVLWDSTTGAHLRTFGGAGFRIIGVDFARDGNWAILAAQDGRVRVQDIATGATVHDMQAHPTAIACLATSRSGAHFATGSTAGEVAIWDASTLALLHRVDLSAQLDQVRALAFSPDDQMLLAGGALNVFDGASILLDVATAGPIHVNSFGANIDAVAYSPNGDEYAVTGTFHGSVERFAAATGQPIATHQCPTATYLRLVYTPGGEALLLTTQCASPNESCVGSIRLADGECAAIAPGLDGTPSTLRFSDDGATLLLATRNGQARLLDSTTYQPTVALHGHTPAQRALAAAHDGTILTGGINGSIVRWDPFEATPLATATLGGGAIHDIAMLGEDTVAAGNAAGQIASFSFPSLTPIAAWTAHAGAVRSLAVHDGLLASASEDRTAAIWTPPAQQPLARLEGLDSTAWAIALHEDAAWIGTHTGRLQRWQFNDPGVEPLSAQLHAGPIFDLALNSSEGVLLSAGADGYARLSNPATLQETGQVQPANTVHAVDAEGGLIATGDSSGAVILWRMGGMVTRLLGHTLTVDEVAFHDNASRLYTTGLDGLTLHYELAPPRAIVVAGGGPYAGNAIARQTHELGVYTYRTLLARGYAAEDVLYLSAFPEGTAFAGGSVVAWDIDGDGLDDVDGLATREALEGALAGDFAREAGRLLVLMMDHGYRTGDTVAFRLNPTEAVTTIQMNAMLDTLQNIAAVDVTLVVDCCYSGQFAIDCAKTDAVPPDRERIVIASTSPTTEAVFLPAPDLTSFMYTFLSSAYMGNSMGEAFRSGARFFRYFPVAGQSPRIHDGELLYTDDELFESPANKSFFGATWAYGVQADKNINQFFPAFASVEPAGTVAPGEPITLRATMLPFQSPERVTVAILPPAPTVLSGEPIVGLPRAELVRISDDRAAGEVWEITLAPGDPAFPFSEEGAYRATFTAQFGFNRNSDPERTAFTITSGPDPDATEIRAVLAFGSSIHAPTAESLDGAAKYAYAVYLDRYQDPNGDRRADWIDVYTTAPLKYAKDSTRRIEQRAAEALVYTKTGAPTTAAILASIATRGAEAGRLVVHLAGDDASDATLRFGNGETLTAAQLDATLDGISSDEIIVIIDAPGSGSFLAPLAATGDQQRVVLTSGRAGDCAIFLADPAITYTHKLLAPLWGGVSFDAAHRSADGFFRSFVGEFAGTRIAPQLDDNGDGVYTFADGALASRLYMGRRYAFAGDEASGLPFIIASEVIPPTAPGLAATLRVRLLEGIEPATDATPDPLDAARVYAQFTPPGVLCGEGATTLPRFRLRRENATAWTWSAPIAPAFLEGLGTGQHPVMFYAEYPDGSTTKMSEPVLQTLNISLTPGVWLLR